MRKNMVSITKWAGLIAPVFYIVSVESAVAGQEAALSTIGAGRAHHPARGRDTQHR